MKLQLKFFILYFVIETALAKFSNQENNDEVDFRHISFQGKLSEKNYLLII